MRNISTGWSARSIRITASLTESRLISVACSAITVACASPFPPRAAPGVLLSQRVLPRRFGPLAVGDVAGVLVHPPAITTQPLGDVLGRIIERGVGIRRLAFAAQRQAAAGMQR